MKIILLSLLYNDITAANINSKIPLQMAPHTFQNAFIYGLQQQPNIDFIIINVMPVGSYPIRYKKIRIKRKIWDNGNVDVEYLNLPFIKRISQFNHLKNELKKIVNQQNQSNTVIICYSIYGPFLKAMKSIKRCYSNVLNIVIQTDAIPGRNGMKKGIFYKIWGNSIIRKTKTTDAFILFTKYLNNALRVGTRPYKVIEGIANTKNIILTTKKHTPHNPRIILYTGAVNLEYNICDIVNAVVSLRGRAELWICGGGNAISYIKEISKKCSFIKYYGVLKQNELVDLREKCDFFINPRRPTGTYTLYSFPSKTMEYMLSTRPLIMYKLEGISDEYDQYINYIKGTDFSSIADDLKYILNQNYNELYQKAIQAQKFIYFQKNEIVQMQKVISFIKEIRR